MSQGAVITSGDRAFPFRRARGIFLIKTVLGWGRRQDSHTSRDCNRSLDFQSHFLERFSFGRGLICRLCQRFRTHAVHAFGRCGPLFFPVKWRPHVLVAVAVNTHTHTPTRRRCFHCYAVSWDENPSDLFSSLLCQVSYLRLVNCV